MRLHTTSEDMKYVAVIALVIVGLLEFILRGILALALAISIVGILVLCDAPDILKPVSFKLAEKCLDDPSKF